MRDDEPDIIAIDGKTSPRSHDRRKGRNPLHLVSAWAARQRIVLGSRRPRRNQRDHRYSPLLLKHLDLIGTLVTMDAIGTQTESPRWSETARSNTKPATHYLCLLALFALTFARTVRAHWGVEDRLHWVLDAVFREDLAALQDRRWAAKYGHHPPYRAPSELTSQTHGQSENPPEARLLECRLPRNRHPPDGVTFKRFARGGDMGSLPHAQFRVNGQSIAPTWAVTRSRCVTEEVRGSTAGEDPPQAAGNNSPDPNKLDEEERASIRRVLRQAGMKPTAETVERLFALIQKGMDMFREARAAQRTSRTS